MDFNDSKEQAEFRAKCTDWLEENAKRKSSIKDTGSFLPGHGGILDRIDGILLGFPVGMIALSFFY